MSGWYVYGVADADRSLQGEGIRLVRDGGLAAIVAPLDLDEFGADQLAERLNDRPWLEEKALAHQDVLSRMARGGPVVPLRFGAIYRRLDDVAELLDARRDELARDLEHVRGREEIGVKGWLDRPRLEQALASERAASSSETPGRAYLERKQVERDVTAEASALLAEIAHLVHERLGGHAVEAVLNRPQARELTGRSEQMFLNAAYLVPAGDELVRREVTALDGEHAALGISFEVTGPWPPYNFVGRAEDAS